jgi:hypothetical protein
MSSPIPGVYKSLVRAVTDMIEALNLEQVIEKPIEFHNWESRGEEANLPRSTLIGIDGFSFDENDGRWMIRFALAISSYLDANLLNEIELIGRIHETFGKNCKVALREMSAGEIVSELVVTEFRTLPMAQSEIRNYRTIGVELNRTGV